MGSDGDILDRSAELRESTEPVRQFPPRMGRTHPSVKTRTGTDLSKLPLSYEVEGYERYCFWNLRSEVLEYGHALWEIIQCDLRFSFGVEKVGGTSAII